MSERKNELLLFNIIMFTLWLLDQIYYMFIHN